MSEWMSVKDKLPRVRNSGFSKYVLGFSGGSTMQTVRLKAGVWCDTSEQKRRVTHWMPLPDTPGDRQ